MIKTNAARVLDRLAINYELREYHVDPSDLSAETVAAKIGLPPEQVFKTLVVHGDRNGICLGVISANQELNVKALANQTGDRKIEMVPLKDVQKGLPRIYRRACGALRRDLSVCRHTRTADPARAFRLHSCCPGLGRSHRKGEVTGDLSC